MIASVFAARARGGLPATDASDRTVMLNGRRELNDAGQRGLASHSEELRDARDTPVLEPRGSRSFTEVTHASASVKADTATADIAAGRAQDRQHERDTPPKSAGAYARWSSQAARRAHNPKVEGSNPSLAPDGPDLARARELGPSRLPLGHVPVDDAVPVAGVAFIAIACGYWLFNLSCALGWWS